MKTYLCKDYDKSKIPEGLEIPVYWKIREASDILNERNKSYDGPTKSNIFNTESVESSILSILYF